MARKARPPRSSATLVRAQSEYGMLIGLLCAFTLVLAFFAMWQVMSWANSITGNLQYLPDATYHLTH